MEREKVFCNNCSVKCYDNLSYSDFIDLYNLNNKSKDEIIDFIIEHKKEIYSIKPSFSLYFNFILPNDFSEEDLIKYFYGYYDSNNRYKPNYKSLYFCLRSSFINFNNNCEFYEPKIKPIKYIINLVKNITK